MGTGMFVCVESDSLSDRIEVEGGREGREWSSGGFRSDLRSTVVSGSEVGTAEILRLRGRVFLGRIY